MSEKTITTLFVDIGGVLLSNGWGHEFRHRAAGKFNLDKQAMDERHSTVFMPYERGELTLEEYLKKVVFYQKRDFTIREFRDYMFSLTTPHAGMINLIKSLKRQYGLKVVAVSNEARELNAYRIRTFELTGVIDFFVSSCYVHLRKPDARIFELALDLTAAAPDEVIYIDDIQQFVDVAEEMGIKSICHAEYSLTRDALAASGLTIMLDLCEAANLNNL
ncbi:HAD family hydrolase [Neolewinella antarctica]|uniref:Hydrolase of the HAD superfamily n=1 Tax=Neolewinella antarctica TaxID=442734 RepID=A0ABX0XCM9_9BACT|nr:HAD family phosphatase [Neolewinella antarctica]NJC26962.1 putative hydrolase of the HAD superfamily [Neolewinella antarctica]